MLAYHLSLMAGLFLGANMANGHFLHLSRIGRYDHARLHFHCLISYRLHFL